ncbi:hypothetical protein KCG48_05065 [Proteiniclasticum sp. BAD-10]|uniref:Uncharacterized protein n=1 Tax=Proteiniclasticum sediminis TaxID=2804028 RepID=A0A941HPR6_9CLOT|nr:hypothetical protein [Proteiniclasticum sediminis]MBR0575711.1 hypothetical protein [Proteiniclasticum sediminis]
MEITLKIEAPGLMEAILALAEQLQEHNALIAGKPAPTGAITTGKISESKTKKKEAAPMIPDPVEVVEDPAPEASEDIDMETARELVMKSKAHKEKAKEVMTTMGIRKITEMDQAQINELYKALQEVK